MQKAFSRSIAPMCEYCAHGSPCRGTDAVVCPKKGVMKRDDHCRSFKYDPIGRTPAAAPELEKHEKNEFELD